jgi:hypothetical protein
MAHHTGVEFHMIAGAIWALPAADALHAHNHQAFLGECYLYGDRVKQDVVMAAACLRKAAVSFKSVMNL